MILNYAIVYQMIVYIGYDWLVAPYIEHFYESVSEDTYAPYLQLINLQQPSQYYKLKLDIDAIVLYPCLQTLLAAISLVNCMQLVRQSVSRFEGLAVSSVYRLTLKLTEGKTVARYQ